MQQPVSHVPVHSRLVAGLDKTPIGHHVIRPGGTRDHLLMLTLSGTGVLRRGKRKTPLTPGTIALIPPGVAHDYGMGPESHQWEVIWAHFHAWPHWKEWLNQISAPDDAGVLTLDNTTLGSSAEDAFREMYHEAFSSNPQRVPSAMNRLERVLLICLQALSPDESPRRDERITRTLEHMAQHLAEPMTIAGLAAIAGLSSSRFAHLFTEQTGATPVRYLEMLRMDRARDLLACTVQPVAEIAAEVGFDEPFYFSRRFRKTNGMSPRAFRQAANADA